jgi:hypothetical protein
MDSIASNNPKEYWKLVEDLRNLDSNQKSDANIPSADLLSHFQNLLHQSNTVDPKLSDSIDKIKAEPFFAETDFAITEKEIVSKIMSLKSGKSPGLDQIDSVMLKASIPIMTPIYLKLFNRIYNEGVYPERWNSGFIVNLHKGGASDDPNNYRGITVNSSLAKVFCMVLNDRLTKYISDHKLVPPQQIGFKKQARTSDHMFIIRTLLDKYVNQNQPVYTCFVDFRKAFDNVWRQALLYKLLDLNIRGKLFNIIERMYQHDQVCLKIGQLRTDLFPCNMGVKQGDVLSPNLFNLFLHDLPEYLSGDPTAPFVGGTPINSLLYADDLLIFSLTPDGLQQSLTKLGDYCKKWKLEVNLEKTKILKFCKNGRMCSDSFTLNGTQIRCVQNYKYLGVEFCASGSMSLAKTNIHDRARKALFKLKSCIRDSAIPPSLALKLFDQLIKPICLYGSEIWGADNLSSTKFSKDGGFETAYYKHPIEKLQIHFCKSILGVTKKASNAAIMGELGKFPMGVEVIASILNFWSHATSIDNNPLLSAAVSESIQLDSNGINSWFSFISKLCSLLGVSIPTTSSHIKSIISKLKGRYETHWRHTLLNPQNASGGKLSSYREYKTNLVYEEYLDLVKNTSHRRALTKLRTSNHRLAVETGRYTKPLTPRDDRLCVLCRHSDIHTVESECHFLLICPSLSPLRDLLLRNNLNSVLSSLSTENQFNYLLSAGGSTIVNVAKFVSQELDLRLSLLDASAVPS